MDRGGVFSFLVVREFKGFCSSKVRNDKGIMDLVGKVVGDGFHEIVMNSGEFLCF